MSEGIPDDFNGYLLSDGRCASLEDVETLYGEIVSKVKDMEEVRGILRGLVDECIEAGFHETSLAYLEKEYSITDDPKGLARIHLAAGTVLEKMGDYRSAAVQYEAAFRFPVEGNDTWYFLHNNRGYCLNKLGRHGEAEKLCRTAIEINPARFNAYKNLGLALQGQERYPEAAVLFLKASAISPLDTRALGHLREIFASHRKELEREIPDIDEQLEAAFEAREKLIQ